MKTKKSKAPVKLSPQETKVMGAFSAARQLPVKTLYRVARGLKLSNKLPAHRAMQQHVGVLVARLNRKRRKFVIVPGDRPRTYKIVRRR